MYSDWHKNLSAASGLVYTISYYCLCRIVFLNLVQKPLRTMSVYTKPGKQSSETISCQNNFISSTVFVVSFAYLPSNRSISSHWSNPIIKARFGSVSYRITMFTRVQMVQNVPDSFSYHLVMQSRVVPDCWSRTYRIHAEPYKHNPNPICKGSDT